MTQRCFINVTEGQQEMGERNEKQREIIPEDESWLGFQQKVINCNVTLNPCVEKICITHARMDNV